MEETKIKRESFCMYRSFYEAMKFLPSETKANLLDTLCEYALNGEEIEKDDISKSFFLLMKPQIDANNRRYLNGKNGGAPIGNKNHKKDNQEEQSDIVVKEESEINYDAVVELWNTKICRTLPKVQSVSNDRKKKIKIRCEQWSKLGSYLDVFGNIIEKVNNSSFLNGSNKKSWKCQFDWVFLNDTNWRKILEGNYDNSNSQAGIEYANTNDRSQELF